MCLLLVVKNEKQKQYHTAGTVPKSNQQIVYMGIWYVHFPGLVQEQ